MADQHDYDDLMGVDLSAVDLDDIDLGEEPPRSGRRWLAALLLIGTMGLALWLPETSFYAQYGHTNGFFFLMCGIAIVVGLTGGRWLWAWAQEAAARYAARRLRQPPRPEGPPSAWSRALTLGAALAGGTAILFWLPSSGQPSGGDGSWFFAAAGAVVVGILLGRWLLMQPARSEGTAARQPIVLPKWVKWVTLALLVTGGLAILGGNLFYGDNIPETLEFSMGGGALVLGVGAAIWLVRRFDETERKIREEALRRRRGTPG